MKVCAKKSLKNLNVSNGQQATATPAVPKVLTASMTPSILIGMCGSGKSHIGVLASRALSLPLLDFDVHFGSLYPPSVCTYVQMHRWPAFWAAETELLYTLLSTSPISTKRASGLHTAIRSESRTCMCVASRGLRSVLGMSLATMPWWSMVWRAMWRGSLAMCLGQSLTEDLSWQGAVTNRPLAMTNLPHDERGCT